MKSLYKKISALALSAVVVAGGVSASGLKSFADSIGSISERSLLGKPLDPNKFLGESEQFKKDYDRIIDEMRKKDPKEIEAYGKEFDKVPNAFNGFRLGYAPLPNDALEQLKRKGYRFCELEAYPKSLSSAIYYVYYGRIFRQKNCVIRFKDGNRDYKFLFYVY